MKSQLEGLCDEHAGEPYVRRCAACEAIRDGQARSPAMFAPLPVEPDYSEWIREDG